MVSGLINANPIVYGKKERRTRNTPVNVDEYAVEPIDQQEIFDHIRDIKDPEHPYSLEELKVISEDAIEVDDERSHVRVTFTPTVEHCSMATVIGLCLRVKLMRSLPPCFKVDIRVAPGSHATEAAGICKEGHENYSTVPPVNRIHHCQTLAHVSAWGGSSPAQVYDAVNKQLNDKERVAAALENPNLVEMVDECLKPSFD